MRTSGHYATVIIEHQMHTAESRHTSGQENKGQNKCGDKTNSLARNERE
jgi:hypothetical protein